MWLAQATPGTPTWHIWPQPQPRALRGLGTHHLAVPLALLGWGHHPRNWGAEACRSQRDTARTWIRLCWRCRSAGGSVTARDKPLALLSAQAPRDTALPGCRVYSPPREVSRRTSRPGAIPGSDAGGCAWYMGGPSALASPREGNSASSCGWWEWGEPGWGAPPWAHSPCGVAPRCPPPCTLPLAHALQGCPGAVGPTRSLTKHQELLQSP